MRFRMGQKMKGILKILNDHEGNPPYSGLTQTEIILRYHVIKRYKRKYGKDTSLYRNMINRKDVESEVEQLKMKYPDKEVKVIDLSPNFPDVLIKVMGDEAPSIVEYTPSYPYQVLASALAERKITSSNPLSFSEELRVIDLKLWSPEEAKKDPVVQKLHAWSNRLQMWGRDADRLYASFSPSIQNLLKWRLIKSNWTRGEKDIRWFNARYCITQVGKDYLEKGSPPTPR